MKAYLKSISAHEPLTRRRETELFRRAHAGDHVALQEVIEANLRFVVSVAREYEGGTLAFEELVSEGNIGLLEAAQRFDPGRGTRFITYAVWWIRNAIRTSLDQSGRAVRPPTTHGPDLRRLRATTERLGQAIGRAPSASEVDAHAGLSDQRILAARTRAGQDLSLEAPTVDGRHLAERLAGGVIPADESFARTQCRTDVDAALSTLPERERRVLRASFGFDRDTPATLQEIGCSLGVTRERARQIKARALDRLRSNRAQCAVLEGWTDADITFVARNGGDECQ